MPTHWMAVAVASFLEMEAVSFGQFMFSRPMVLGPIIGAVLGRADVGFFIGALVELLGLDDVPAGGHIPLNGAVATAACLILALGPLRLALPLAFPSGLLAGWSHAKAESFLRQRRAAFCVSVEKILDSGGKPPLLRISFINAAMQACLTSLIVAAAVFLAGPALSWSWPRLPETIQDGLEFGLTACPALAAVGLLDAVRTKE